MPQKPCREKSSVALLAEGVDRNRLSPSRAPARIVALLAEGVDRNVDDRQGDRQYYVALLAEGVDRNHIAQHIHLGGNGRPPRGGRG